MHELVLRTRLLVAHRVSSDRNFEVSRECPRTGTGKEK